MTRVNFVVVVVMVVMDTGNSELCLEIMDAAFAESVSRHFVLRFACFVCLSLYFLMRQREDS